jgi:hypothetical protein
MKFVVQSFSDLITNSSSEVFVSVQNEDLINALKQMNIDYDIYNDEESLRQAVEDNPWMFDGVVDYNPYREFWMDELKENKTSDEIWDFFKSFYIHLIGKVIIDVDRDYLYRQEDEHSIYLRKYIKEK